MTEDELYHYGIKGMKWGIRRFQDKHGRLTSSGKKRYSEGGRHGKKGDENSSDRKGLSEKQKRAIKVGAAVAGTALVAYGGYRLYKSGKLNPYIDKYINSGKSVVGDVQGINVPVSKTVPDDSRIDSVLKQSNKNGNSENCYNVVAEVTARLLGRDLNAKGPTAIPGDRFDRLCRLFKQNPDDDTKVRSVNNPTIEKISNSIVRQYERGKIKDGDIGAIAFEFGDDYKRIFNIPSNNSAAHTLNWIIKNGKVTFMDGQPKNGYSGDNLYSYLSKYMSSKKEARYVRFANISDNLEDVVDMSMLYDFVD